ncbi:hypothetical protein ES703_114428 [subsurface metagenome]
MTGIQNNNPVVRFQSFKPASELVILYVIGIGVKQCIIRTYIVITQIITSMSREKEQYHIIGIFTGG